MAAPWDSYSGSNLPACLVRICLKEVCSYIRGLSIATFAAMKTFMYLLIFLSASSAIAEEVQLGIILGSTSGLSFKDEIGSDRAIDAALSYSIQGKYGLSLHADYLFNRVRQFSFGQLSPVFLYYGLGARTLNIRTGTDEAVLVRR